VGSVGSVVIKIFEINMNLGFIKPQSPQRTQRGWFIPSPVRSLCRISISLELSDVVIFDEAIA
jgi:hypothetical protein